MSSAKWRPFCLGLNVLTVVWLTAYVTIFNYLPELIVVADSHGREGKFVHIRYFYIYFSRIIINENQSSRHNIYE